MSISTLSGTSGEFVLIPASKHRLFPAFPTDRVFAQVERPQSSLGNTSAVLPVTVKRRSPASDDGDPASAARYHRLDLAGWPRLAVPVPPGKRPPVPVPAATLPPAAPLSRPLDAQPNLLRLVGGLGLSRSLRALRPLQQQVPFGST